MLAIVSGVLNIFLSFLPPTIAFGKRKAHTLIREVERTKPLRKASVMCNGVTEVDRVVEQFEHGVVLEMMLVKTCEEHDGVTVGLGVLTHGDKIVQTFEPFEFAEGEDGLIRFRDAVSMIGADVKMQLALADALGLFDSGDGI